MSLDDIGLPEGIREVIGRRLARLSVECRKLLVTASVLGRHFDAQTLEEVAAVEAQRVNDLLQEATDAQIVEAEPRGSGRRFSHALIRETLYGELAAGERVRLHRKVADSLHRLHADDLDAHLSELAYHYFEASAGGDVEQAIEFATRAAEHADRQLAYEEAASFYHRALRVLEASDRPDEGRQCELLLRLGTAQWRSVEGQKSKESLLRAAELAARTGRAEVLAHAAITYQGEELQTMFAAMQQDMVPLLEKALAALPDADGALRATVMGRLAGSLYYSGQDERRRRLFEEAADMATRVGDKRALASVITNKLTALWGAETLPRLRADCATLARLSGELDDERVQLINCGFQGIIAAESGDYDAALPWFTEGRRICERVPHLRWFLEHVANGWAFAACKPVDADRLIQNVEDIGHLGAEREAALMLISFQKAVLHWQYGRSKQSTAIFKHFPGTAHMRTHPMWQSWSALSEDESDRRAAVDRVRDLSAVPKDTFWVGPVAFGATQVEAFGEVEVARNLYEALLPHGDRCVNPGMIICFGSVSRYLALLAKTLSRYGDAEAHFDRALEMERHMPLWQARTRYDYARLLALRAAPGDRERAIALCSQAIEGAREYGLQRVVGDAVALKLELQGVASANVRSSIDAVAASIEANGVDLRRATAPNGTVTLLFTDMEGFSELTEELGDLEAHRLMHKHRTLLRRELQPHGGSEIEEQGDGFLFAFPKATEALRYATTVQRTLAAHRAERPEDRIHVRMGLHTGEPIKEGQRFYGKTVILAARIAEHAKGDEILVSSLVRELAESAGEFRFDDGEATELKGLSGMHRIHGVAWSESGGVRSFRSAGVAERPAPENVFRKEGDYWTIIYEGRSIRMKDAKGVQYIAALLRRPGAEVHAAELVNGASVVPSGPPSVDLTVAADLGDAGEMLDAKARDDYRARLDTLRSELEEAQAMNDIGRSERLRQEMEFLTQELSAAYGLGGRVRRNSSAIDRARKAVSSRVLDSISRITRENPELGTHLGNCIRLGLFCRYQPEKPIKWNL